MNGDTPIHRKTFLEMSIEEQEVFVNQLRERRLSPINSYKEVQEALKQKKISKLTEKANKQLAIFDKQIDKINKDFDKLDEIANKLNMLKLELDLD